MNNNNNNEAVIKNFMLFDLNKFDKIGYYKDLDQFLNEGATVDPTYYWSFVSFYSLILKNHIFKNMINDMHSAVKISDLYKVKKKYIKTLQTRWKEYNDVYNCDLLVVVMSYILMVSLTNEKVNFEINEVYFSIDRYILLNNLLIYLEKIIVFYTYDIGFNRGEMTYFVIRYMEILEHAGFLKKNKYWIDDHTALIYYKKMPAIFATPEANPYTSISLSEYSLKENFLIGAHFSNTINLFIKNDASNKTFTFKDLSKPELFNKKCLKISLKNYELILNFLTTILSVNEEIPHKQYKIKQDDKYIYSKSIKLNDFLFFKEKVLLNSNSVYFAQCFDTRGRMYGISKFSPTNLKVMRLCCEEEEVVGDINLSKTYQKLKKYFNVLGEYQSVDGRVNAMLIHLFISLGKISRNKICYRVGLKSLLKSGINEYQAETATDIKSKSLLYEIVEKKIIKKIISEILILGYDCPNYIIPKDATASGWQHLTRCLGFKNNENKWVNFDDSPLDGEAEDLYWTDTYSKIISSFISDVKLPEVYFQYFIRQNLKSTIMTINYGATLYRCQNEFFEKIGFIDKEIGKYFELFYLYIQKLPWFKHDVKKLETILWNNQTVNFFDSEVCFTLYKKEPYRVDFTIQGKRSSILLYRTTNEINEKKTKQALRANFVHACDSHVLRSMKIRCHSVHDCILVGIKNVCFVLDDYNRVMSKQSAPIFLESGVVVDSIFSLI